MNAKRKVSVVSLAGVVILMFAPAQPAAADNWCTSIKLNDRPLFGEPLCKTIIGFAKDPIPGDGIPGGVLNPQR